jgi:amidase
MSRTTISYEDSHVFAFEPAMEPAYNARSGEALTIETIDGLSGAIQTNEDLLGAMARGSERGDRPDRGRGSDAG